MIKGILSNSFVVLMIIGGIILATIYSDSIKKKMLDVMHVQTDRVLGVKIIGETIDPQVKQKELTNQANDFVTSQFELAKKQVLNIKIGDVLATLDNSKKIVRDVQSAAEYTHTEVVKLQKKLPLLTDEKNKKTP